MKKFIITFSIIITMVLGMSSCSKDEPGGKLTGNWYAAQLPNKGDKDWGGRAYYFNSSNTVTYYPMISGSTYWGVQWSEELTGPMKGYYIQGGIKETYTYTVSDNKIIIPMQGVILTIDGNTLYKDGGGVFTKM